MKAEIESHCCLKSGPPLSSGKIMFDAKILIVDDTPQNRMTLSDMVLKMGYIPVPVESIAAAELLLPLEYDLVLLDLELGKGKSSLSLLESIKSPNSEYPFLPVIMISVTTDKQKIVECLKAGADDYLVNPYEEEELRARIKNTLERYRLLKKVDAGRDEAKQLNESILPTNVAKDIIEKGTFEPVTHRNVAVLFCDIVRFTSDSQSKPALQVFKNLHELVIKFEYLARSHNVEKIKTIGDAFMAVANLHISNPKPVEMCVNFGKDMINEAHERGYKVRVGIHVGTVTGGVIGHHRYTYDIIGHTVNVASRIEGAAKPNSICVSTQAYEKIKEKYPDAEATPETLNHVLYHGPVYHIWRKP